MRPHGGAFSGGQQDTWRRQTHAAQGVPALQSSMNELIHRRQPSPLPLAVAAVVDGRTGLIFLSRSAGQCHCSWVCGVVCGMQGVRQTKSDVRFVHTGHALTTLNNLPTKAVSPCSQGKRIWADEDGPACGLVVRVPLPRPPTAQIGRARRWLVKALS